jgi:peroxiredoxin
MYHPHFFSNMHFLNITALFTLLFAATALNAQKTAKDSTYIDVTIQGLAAGKTRLVGTFGDQNYLADSAMVDANGHFLVRRDHPLPAGFYTFLIGGSKSFSFLLDDNDQHLTIRANFADLVGSFQVEGGLNTGLFYESFRVQGKDDAEMARISETIKSNKSDSEPYKEALKRQKEILDARKAWLDDVAQKHPNALFTKFKIAGQNPEWITYKKPNGDTDTIRQLVSFRNRFWDGVDFNDKRLLYTPVIVNKLKRFVKDFTPQNPDSIINVVDPFIRKSIPYKDYFKFFSNWIALQYENGKTTVMDGEAVYVHVVKNFFTPELAFWDNKESLEKLQKHVWEMEASLMGRKGPDVRAQDMNGQMKSIYEITAPLVVIFMFSPDCEHCQKEAPEIERLYKKWKPLGVDFYGIAVNTTEPEWRDFVKKSGFSFTNVFDPSNRAIYAKYFVDITPELYVLNKDRTIVAKNLKAEQLETIFERELKKIK